MGEDEARKLGYEVIAASPFEVGLVKNGKGMRTWWAHDFDGKMPTLAHPKILEAVEAWETFQREYNNAFGDHQF